MQDVLAEKKNADLKNQQVLIGAKANKQTKVSSPWLDSDCVHAGCHVFTTVSLLFV